MGDVRTYYAFYDVDASPVIFSDETYSELAKEWFVKFDTFFYPPASAADMFAKRGPSCVKTVGTSLYAADQDSTPASTGVFPPVISPAPESPAPPVAPENTAKSSRARKGDSVLPPANPSTHTVSFPTGL